MLHRVPSSTARRGPASLGLKQAFTKAHSTSLFEFRARGFASDTYMFPQPDGLYSTAVLDLEFDADPTARALPFSEGQAQPEESPDPEQHLVGRLFYPTASAERKPNLRYINHRNYAVGFGRYGTLAFKQWWSGALRSALTAVIYASTIFEKIPVYSGKPADAAGSSKLPVIVFSHGMGGNRLIYSHLLTQWASMGFVVLAVEHTDGMGSTARLAGKRGWMYFKGWGPGNFIDNCVEHRLAEMRHAVRLLHAVNAEGSGVRHLSTLCARRAQGAAALDSLKGALNMDALVLSGHSFGGATAAGVAPDLPQARCTVLIDPWWPAIPKPRRDALKEASQNPMLVLGSSRFNVQRQDGAALVCEGQAPGLQDQVIGAFTGAATGATGREALLVVPAQSHHTMADDVGAIFKDRYAWLFKLFRIGYLGPQGPASKDAGLDLANRCTDAMLAFIGHHVMLPARLQSGLQERLQRYQVPNTQKPLQYEPAGGYGAHGDTVWQEQAAIFSGGSYNNHDRNGIDVMKRYVRSANGQATAERVSSAQLSERKDPVAAG